MLSSAGSTPLLLVNKRFCEITARTESELLSLCVPDVTHPDDRAVNIERLSRLAADGVPFIVEKRYVRPDGSDVWVSSNVALTRDGEGRPQHFVAVIQDITERKRSQEQQELLMGELNNSGQEPVCCYEQRDLAQRKVRSNGRGFDEKDTRQAQCAGACPRAYPAGFIEQADAKAQPTSLNNLLHKILSPYIDSGDTAEHRRVVVSGPPVAVGARAVTNLALILHEFATNAAKYGALSVSEGSVHIEWSERDGVLVLKWAEHGGPKLAAPPTTRGFGTLLSGHSIRGQLGGNLTYDWNPNGLVVELSFRVERLRD